MWLHVLVFFTTFCFMEFMAWFSHKYIMHGFLWSLHADHHKKDHDSWFERNDAFFIFYALVSIGCFLLWKYEILEIGLAIGIGIFAYGLAYFLVHDIALSCLEMPIIAMRELLEELTKCITNILEKNMENVSEC